MEKAIEASIKALAAAANGINVAAHEAMQLTQAVLNLAHARQVLQVDKAR